MITEDYVSFETAKLLKEKGFDEFTQFVWYDKCPPSISRAEQFERKLDYFYLNKSTETPSRFCNNGYIPDYIPGNVYSAPTLQMAMKWLREDKRLVIIVDYNALLYSPTPFYFHIFDYGKISSRDKDKAPIDTYYNYKYKTPEEAAEAAIKYCLEKGMEKEGNKKVAGVPRFEVGDVVTFAHNTAPFSDKMKYRVCKVTILSPCGASEGRVTYDIATKSPVPFSTITGVEEDELEFAVGVKDNPILKVDAERVPYSWEEFCETHPIQIGECLLTAFSNYYEAKSEQTRHKDSNKVCLPDKETAEAFIAMIQLIQLRNCYNDGWEPDWEDSEERKYVIIIVDNKIDTTDLSSSSCPLAFRTEERRDLFLKNFRDLIEIAKPLI